MSKRERVSKATRSQESGIRGVRVWVRGERARACPDTSTLKPPDS
jgi:hypothetical protein